MLAGGKRKHFYRTHNPKILSITAVRFDEYFGFTGAEVAKREIEALIAGEVMVAEE